MPALQPQAASQPTIPDAATLEHALRAAVRDVYRAGNLEELTVRRIRRVVELELGLEEGFFKSEPEAEVEQEQQEGKAKGKGEGWKERSKRIISGEVVSFFCFRVLVFLSSEKGGWGWGGLAVLSRLV